MLRKISSDVYVIELPTDLHVILMFLTCILLRVSMGILLKFLSRCCNFLSLKIEVIEDVLDFKEARSRSDHKYRRFLVK